MVDYIVGFTTYKSCLEEGLATASTNAISTCNANLEEVTAGADVMCRY